MTLKCESLDYILINFPCVKPLVNALFLEHLSYFFVFKNIFEEFAKPGTTQYNKNTD